MKILRLKKGLAKAGTTVSVNDAATSDGAFGLNADAFSAMDNYQKTNFASTRGMPASGDTPDSSMRETSERTGGGSTGAGGGGGGKDKSPGDQTAPGGAGHRPHGGAYGAGWTPPVGGDINVLKGWGSTAMPGGGSIPGGPPVFSAKPGSPVSPGGYTAPHSPSLPPKPNPFGYTGPHSPYQGPGGGYTGPKSPYYGPSSQSPLENVIYTDYAFDIEQPMALKTNTII